MCEHPGLPIHIKSLVRPLSVGALFVEHNLLHALPDADNFGLLQLGRFKYTTLSLGTGCKACILCGAAEHGLPHILKSCRALSDERGIFLGSVDANWCNSLASSPQGDWPTAILSPHQGIERLQRAAQFTTGVVKKLNSSGAAL